MEEYWYIIVKNSGVAREQTNKCSVDNFAQKTSTVTGLLGTGTYYQKYLKYKMILENT
jgi:hypothetical protein